MLIIRQSIHLYPHIIHSTDVKHLNVVYRTALIFLREKMQMHRRNQSAYPLETICNY